jgi:hypothetical protein
MTILMQLLVEPLVEVMVLLGSSTTRVPNFLYGLESAGYGLRYLCGDLVHSHFKHLAMSFMAQDGLEFSTSVLDT